ncbi:MAG: hypothetical protein K1X78_16550 [Verrucomicrobiaceae bacterium]|nr:hypothetical protein [Verrucomicrobiaceae bacterium]
MKRSYSRFLAVASIPLLALALSGCGKKQSPPGSAAAPAAAAEKAPAAAPGAPAQASGIAAHAAKLGFAGHLPKSTELYVGSANLKAHLDAAKKTAFWKDVSSFIDDKVPAAGKPAAPASDSFKKLWGDDVFVALCKGAGPALAGLREFSEVYTEITYRGIMAGSPLAGGAAGGAVPAAASEPEKIARALLADPKLLKRAADLVGGLKIPPLIFGVKTEKPDELLKQLLPADKLAEMSKNAKTSEVTTALGGKFKCFELPVKQFLTDELKKKLVDGIPDKPGADSPRPVIAKALDELQAKTLAWAFGSAAGHVIIALGPDVSHLEFADKPENSLLAKSEFDKVLPYAGKDVLLLASADAAVMQSMASDQPMQPMLRGLVAGLKGSEIFGSLAAGLEPRLAEMGALEKKLYKRTFSNAVAVGWWDQGLHVESFGGLETEMFDTARPLKFAPLLDDPGLVLGFNYHTNPEFSATGRAYTESWLELVHYLAGEIVKKGLGGPQGGMMFEMIDKSVIPELVNFYHGSKTIDEKALGTEQALVLDLGGKLGGLPGLPPEAAEKKMVRIAGVHSVLDRPLIGTNWTAMEASLKRMFAAIPSPTPIPVPAPMSAEKNGITTWFYPIPLATEDLLPCASVNDQLFIFGTSKNLNESIAGRMAAPKPADANTGLKWRVSFGNIREIIKISSSLSPNTDAAGNAKTATRWIMPFENMSGRWWKENGLRRDSMTWEIHDVKKFD